MEIKILLSQINEEIQKTSYGTHPNDLYEPISYLMALGGKRMRPLLVLLGYYLFRDDYGKILRPALAVEVFHNFTLMHDDIMDKAPLRRNQPTVHHKWNENIAILSGDVMLVNAYNLLLDVEQDKLKLILQKFNLCAAQVCEGQQLDMNFESLESVSEEDYINMIRLKTAVLLGFSLEMGALLSDTTQENATLLYDFGVNIGIGFQLKDDLLDVYGDKDKFGKQVGGDIAANKKTFLLIEALNLANETQRKNLDFWLAKTDFSKLDYSDITLEEKVKAVTDIYNELNIKELTEKKIRAYFDKAFDALAHLQATPARKQVLEDFTRDLIDREN